MDPKITPEHQRELDLSFRDIIIAVAIGSVLSTFGMALLLFVLDVL